MRSLGKNRHVARSVWSPASQEPTTDQRPNGVADNIDACVGAGFLTLSPQDPVDHLLIAQSIEEELTIVTADSQFSTYAVKLL